MERPKTIYTATHVSLVSPLLTAILFAPSLRDALSSVPNTVMDSVGQLATDLFQLANGLQRDEFWVRRSIMSQYFPVS